MASTTAPFVLVAAGLLVLCQFASVMASAVQARDGGAVSQSAQEFGLVMSSLFMPSMIFLGLLATVQSS